MGKSIGRVARQRKTASTTIIAAAVASAHHGAPRAERRLRQGSRHLGRPDQCDPRLTDGLQAELRILLQAAAEQRAHVRRGGLRDFRLLHDHRGQIPPKPSRPRTWRGR